MGGLGRRGVLLAAQCSGGGGVDESMHRDSNRAGVLCGLHFEERERKEAESSREEALSEAQVAVLQCGSGGRSGPEHGGAALRRRSSAARHEKQEVEREWAGSERRAPKDRSLLRRGEKMMVPPFRVGPSGSIIAG